MPDIHTLTEVANILGIRLAKLEKRLDEAREASRTLDAYRRADRETLRGLYTLVHQAVPEIRGLALRVDRIGEWVDSIRVQVPVEEEKVRKSYDRGLWLQSGMEAFARQHQQALRPSTVGYRPNAPLNVDLKTAAEFERECASIPPRYSGSRPTLYIDPCGRKAYGLKATAIIVDDPYGDKISRAWARVAEKSLKPPKSARQKARRKARMKARRAQRV